jgi:hypothetical protein
MVQNMLSYFTNISAKILMHILGNSFCTKRHILAHFFQLPLPLKAFKIICAKAALLWCQKCW